MPAGGGAEEQKLPEVTFAGMPYCARLPCRAAGWSSSFGLMVSVAVPLELLTRVNDAVRIVPGARAGLPAGLEEVRELRLLVAHNPLTLPSADPHTCEQKSSGAPDRLRHAGPRPGWSWPRIRPLAIPGRQAAAAFPGHM